MTRLFAWLERHLRQRQERFWIQDYGDAFARAARRDEHWYGKARYSAASVQSFRKLD